ncbi:hypothetical protein DEU56DRAFT_759366 [Suillus clintonianus]|uniref:uncharacterized protein n=1 Tax=Suillus clintonianus TaxID=1904413 RepID=UPI001B873CDA|nr:uncharacterized protein DEU56DRAFT_759366 [Suillus clintonianus]KAG2125336.1 hypothetical protein DEU56DRAFT_759366 [Suillus clintonianus]
MEPPSSPSSTITAPPDYRENSRRLAKLIAEAMTCRYALLHYDSASKSMIEWYWPADSDGERIPPSHLEKYRNGHDFKYPCCLCADGGGRGAYMEAAVYSWRNEIAGKTDWIARCASDICGYRVRIDVYFQLSSLGTFQYPQRDPEQRILPIGLEWDHREQAELLSRLGSADGDGIPAREFRVLFKRCKKCMRVRNIKNIVVKLLTIISYHSILLVLLVTAGHCDLGIHKGAECTIFIQKGGQKLTRGSSHTCSVKYSKSGAYLHPLNYFHFEHFVLIRENDTWKGAPTIEDGDADFVIDIVGTREDGHNTFNVSTTGLFCICYGNLADESNNKHQSKGSTSSSGSADLLQTLDCLFAAPSLSLAMRFHPFNPFVTYQTTIGRSCALVHMKLSEVSKERLVLTDAATIKPTPPSLSTAQTDQMFWKDLRCPPIPRQLRHNPDKPFHFGMLLNVSFGIGTTLVVANLYYCQLTKRGKNLSLMNVSEVQLSASFYITYDEGARIPTVFKSLFNVAIGDMAHGVFRIQSRSPLAANEFEIQTQGRA